MQIMSASRIGFKASKVGIENTQVFKHRVFSHISHKCGSDRRTNVGV